MAATTYAVTAGVATITLNQPESRNALTPELVSGLLDALTAANADTDVRMVIVTNEGSTFCAGADLNGDSGDSAVALVSVMQAVMEAPKPVIGHINGHCMGGGVGLAAAFDISVVRDDAKFAFSEARLGVAPAVISVVCLPKMRKADASELFLRANRFSGSHAAKVGLVNHAVPVNDLAATTQQIVTDVLAGGPQALIACKQLLADGSEVRSARFAEVAKLSRDLFASDEGREGVAAFKERRPARWNPAEK
jgi:methylglutaconyl-CoA hydratase